MQNNVVAAATKFTISAWIAGIASYLGWLEWLIVIQVVCMVIDIIVGSLAAAKRGEWNHKAAFTGLLHKIGMLVMLAIAIVVDVVLGVIIRNIPGIKLPFTYDVLFAPLVVIWYIITELGSITVNARDLGAPVPPFLVKALKLLKKSTDTAGENIVFNDEEDGQ